jgi:hypothetical protein
MRRRLGPLLSFAAMLSAVGIVAAGCGSASGGGGSSGGAAGIVPGDAIAFVTVATDTGGTQLKNAAAILDKFPAHTKLVASFDKALAAQGTSVAKLEAAAGPEVDVAILKVAGQPAPVGFTKPSDATAFAALLKNAKSEQISGWTVFASTQAALDAVKNRTSNLSDAPDYQDASKSLPGDTLASAFAGKAAFALAGSLAGKASSQAGAAASSVNLSKLGWVAAAATSHDNGVELEFHVHTTSALPAASSSDSLAGEIPGGVLAAAAFGASSQVSGLSDTALAQPSAAAALGKVQQAIGVSVQDLLEAVNGPGILYVKAGAPLPEVTIVIRPADAQQAQQTVGALIAKLAKGAKPTSTTVNGVSLQSIPIGPVSLYYGAFDGQLVLTDSQTAIGELQSKSNRLADDDTFKAAKKASGLPDSATTWLYMDLQDTIPAVESLATLAGQQVPPKIGPNLQPLKSFVAYGSADGGTSTVVLFLQTN